MNKRIFSFIALAIFAIVCFTSCSKTNTQGRYIPKDAAMVIHLNGESLNAKLPWDEVKQNQFYKDLTADSSIDPFIKLALDNPENTGIDIKKDVLLFVVKDTTGGYLALEGSIKDAAKFKQFNSQATKENAETQKDNIHFLTNNKLTSSWNDSRFVIVFDLPEMNNLNNLPNNWDSASPAPTIAKRDLVNTATSIYNLSKENSLATNDKFSELVNTKGDVHFWLNPQSFNTGNFAMAAMGMMNFSKMYEGSILAATANFDNGQINVDMTSYAGKEMTEIWKKYNGSKINSDFIKKIPAKDIAVLFAMNYKPEGLKELVKLAGMEGFANMGAAYAGFTLDDFVKANKGDLLLAVSDIKKDSLNMPNAQVLFATSIGDKAAFGKLIDAGKKLGANAMGSGIENKIFYNSNDNYFAIGNNKENIDKFISSPSANSLPFFEKAYSGPIGAYVNFQYIFNAIMSNSTDSLDKASFDANIKMWDNLLATGGNFSNGGLTQHFEINLVDKTTNSLKQLNNYIGTMGVIEKKKADYYKSKWDDNSKAEPDSLTNFQK
ncbi:MAG: DUF4836 family protein [Bacteroidetes bacterium]|nr:DUF4836 family protein [Bacteroidota bacterium]MBS1756714.1 DUF4836 family protein [Bacteroidota bacterium]